MRVRSWKVAVVFGLGAAIVAAAALTLGSDIAIACTRTAPQTTACHVDNQHGTGPAAEHEARDFTLPADVTITWDAFSSRRGEEEELVASTSDWTSSRTLLIARDGSLRRVGDRLAAHARDPSSPSFAAKVHGHGRRWYLLAVALLLVVLATAAAVGTRIDPRRSSTHVPAPRR